MSQKRFPETFKKFMGIESLQNEINPSIFKSALLKLSAIQDFKYSLFLQLFKEKNDKFGILIPLNKVKKAKYLQKYKRGSFKNRETI